MAKLYEDIERNVADAGVYQHLNYIATGRLFFPQKVLGSSVGLQGARYELRDSGFVIHSPTSVIRYPSPVNFNLYLKSNT
ncbi:hypothetical protein FHG08_06065 [Pseudoalteromonas sp. Scap03]|nr:hypothetical protein [Pseudoalteromonas sp. Scap03]QLE80446.1 hypothetical protein FLM54_02330 [Pseudoalteromonas sp. Scap25]QLE88389.1 hypothetical protein FLM47_02330 [Pseudoalteromonas sp. Scap06]